MKRNTEAFEQLRSQIENATNFATMSAELKPALERFTPSPTFSEGPRDASYGYTISKNNRSCPEGILYNVTRFSYGRVAEWDPAEDMNPPPRDWRNYEDINILLRYSSEVSFIYTPQYNQSINVNDVVLRDLQLSTFLNTTPLKPVEPITR